MAMRLYSRDEWRAELQSKWQLKPSGYQTATTEIWLTAGGKPISIPELGKDAHYPDSLLNMVEDQLRALHEHPFESRSAKLPAGPDQSKN
jgi:hypothetical protein